jgi:hypothetical protein
VVRQREEERKFAPFLSSGRPSLLFWCAVLQLYMFWPAVPNCYLFVLTCSLQLFSFWSAVSNCFLSWTESPDLFYSSLIFNPQLFSILTCIFKMFSILTRCPQLTPILTCSPQLRAGRSRASVWPDCWSCSSWSWVCLQNTWYAGEQSFFIWPQHIIFIYQTIPTLLFCNGQ